MPRQELSFPTSENRDDVLARRALEFTRKNGGITIRLDGDIPERGYAVALPKIPEKRISLDKVTEQDFEAFIDEHFEELSRENAYVGAWIDDSELILDVAHVVEKKDEALALGRVAEQQAIFNLNQFEEIRL